MKLIFVSKIFICLNLNYAKEKLVYFFIFQLSDKNVFEKLQPEVEIVGKCISNASSKNLSTFFFFSSLFK